MKINDVEIDFNLEYVEDFNRYEEHSTEFFKSIEGLKRDQPGYVASMCDAVRNFFDSLFGAENTDKILGEKMKINVCLNSVASLFEQTEEQARSMHEIAESNAVTTRMLQTRDRLKKINKR